VNEHLIKQEDGFTSIVVVMIIVVIVSLLAFSLLYISKNQTILTKREEFTSKALYTAESGINDYMFLLNKDSNYLNDENHKGDLGWSDYKDGQYHLTVTDIGGGIPGVDISSTGQISYKNSTGAPVNIERTIKARIQKKSFAHYIYFTDSEAGSIWFITGDILRGPVHSNDQIKISGSPVFEQKASTSETFYPPYGQTIGGKTNDADFQQGYEENVDRLDLPPNNTKLRDWAKIGGYYYYGKTTIVLNANGTLTITNTNGVPAGYTKGPTGVASLPSNGAIYVDGMLRNKWDADGGNIFVEGTLSGELTIGASNDIYITDNLLYANSTNDILGLIAQKNIYINHFANPNYQGDVSHDNIEINAVLFALEESIEFEDYWYPSYVWPNNYPMPKDTLTINGALIQSIRGPIGQFSGSTRIRGYSKDYHYDSRLLYKEPPHFLEPTNTGYEITKWEETKTQQ